MTRRPSVAYGVPYGWSARRPRARAANARTRSFRLSSPTAFKSSSRRLSKSLPSCCRAGFDRLSRPIASAADSPTTSFAFGSWSHRTKRGKTIRCSEIFPSAMSAAARTSSRVFLRGSTSCRRKGTIVPRAAAIRRFDHSSSGEIGASPRGVISRRRMATSRPGISPMRLRSHHVCQVSPGVMFCGTGSGPRPGPVGGAPGARNWPPCARAGLARGPSEPTSRSRKSPVRSGTRHALLPRAMPEPTPGLRTHRDRENTNAWVDVSDAPPRPCVGFPESRVVSSSRRCAVHRVEDPGCPSPPG